MAILGTSTSTILPMKCSTSTNHLPSELPAMALFIAGATVTTQSNHLNDLEEAFGILRTVTDDGDFEFYYLQDGSYYLLHLDLRENSFTCDTVVLDPQNYFQIFKEDRVGACMRNSTQLEFWYSQSKTTCRSVCGAAALVVRLSSSRFVLHLLLYYLTKMKRLIKWKLTFHCSIIISMAQSLVEPSTQQGLFYTSIWQGRIQDFKMGGFARASARKLFGHPAHFTCRFSVCELRARIFYSAMLTRAIGQSLC